MSNMAFDFSGRTVVITGAAQGIGLELGRFFHDAKATTFLLDVDEVALKSAAETTGALPVRANVADTPSVDAAIRTVADATGRLDILVNNAGILRDGWLWKQSDDDWDAVLSVHAGGTFKMTRAAVPYFRAQEFGQRDQRHFIYRTARQHRPGELCDSESGNHRLYKSCRA